MSRGKIVLLVVLGLAAYLSFLVVRFPAAQAWRLVGDQVPVRAVGLSGTVWNGQAAEVHQNGRRLEGVGWELHPSALVTGRVAADVRATLPDGRVRGRIERGGDSLQLRDFRLDAATDTLLDMAGERRINAAGRLDAVLRELNVRNGVLHEVDGLINWRNAVIRPGSGLGLRNVSLPLGDLALRLEPAGDGTRGTLVSENSPIELQGELSTDPAAGSFVMNLVLRVTGDLDPDTQRALQLLGVPTDGSPTRSRLTGNLDGSNLRLVPVQG